MLHEFSLILAGPPATLDQVDALYGLLDDGAVITKGGITRVDIDREADTMESAIRSAIGQVVAAGLTVDRVEIAAGQFATVGAG